jgi:hypothetical protein
MDENNYIQTNAEPGVDMEAPHPAQMAFCVHCHDRIYSADIGPWYHLETQRTTCKPQSTEIEKRIRDETHVETLGVLRRLARLVHTGRITRNDVRRKLKLPPIDAPEADALSVTVGNTIQYLDSND